MTTPAESQMDTIVDDGAETDGRRLRRSRNRDAAVDALLGIYREGRLDPSAAEIAERAGLSPRSLFRYFDDVDDLVRAAIERQMSVVMPVLERHIDPTRPLSDRIAAFVEHRLELMQAIGGVGHASRLKAPFHPPIASQLAVMRTYLRRQLELLFATELDVMTATDRRSAIAALDVVSSFEAIDLMAADQDLDVEAQRAALRRAVERLLT